MKLSATHKDTLSLQERLKKLGMLTSFTDTSENMPRKHGECEMEDLQPLVVVQDNAMHK
jgi:hypothetical protein